jgi:hypothetical protein
MEKTKFKKGDIVYWQDLQGEVIEIYSSYYPIRVEFPNRLVDTFTKDGRIFEDTPIVLSHTPYTLNGFTQNEVIEKDTLVWVKDAPYSTWEQRFYSHFENDKHYCFLNQLTSKETDYTNSWDFLETTNPLIK